MNFQKPRISREPDSVKGWYCRTPDGVFGFGTSPENAFWEWFLKQPDRPLLLGKKWVDHNDPVALELLDVGRRRLRMSPVGRLQPTKPTQPKKQVSFIAKLFGF